MLKMRRPVRAEGGFSRLPHREAGFTLVELLITVLLLGTVAASMLTLFVSLVHSAVVAKREAIGSTLATNQMEYLKSLPYDNLVITGGSIYSTGPTLPATKTQKINGVTYTMSTAIDYVDDAFDGCGSYSTLAQKKIYCRNYPATGTPPNDSSPYDYKIISVSVVDSSHNNLADLNTEVAARVAESGTTKGALTVNVIDDSGSPVAGVNVNVVDNSLTPTLNLNGTTDSNGTFIFYDLPPDISGYHYVITASGNSYSTLTTIAPSGTLQPTYSSQNVLTQSSSSVTMTIKPIGVNSLAIEATDASSNPLVGMKIYAKGGYKKYTLTSDTTYCFDNMATANATSCSATSGGDSRPTTDSNGVATLSNLVPGNYIFCGDVGATNCKIGNTTYYLEAAVPYGGNNSFNPIAVPIYDATNPPATTYPYSGVNYLQKVRLIFSTSSTAPRVNTLSPDDVSLATGSPSTFAFTITGTNLPCSATAGSCSTTVKFLQASNTYTASCTGAASGVQLNCTVNLSTASTGSTQLAITANSTTLTIPAALTLGGISVTP